ncbi:hypothetical protein ACH5RR_006137 [Cinchona calisaya]|uniref:BED-type domain-containing protein n=1 Tax=Cinchona calisaya TaxID=153742 RepID=A0ABD3AN63_9GENT
MSSMGDNTKTADVSISVDDQSSSMPLPKIATTVDSASESPPSKKSKVSEASKKTQNKSWVWNHYDVVEGLDKKEKKATCKYCGSLISCSSRHGTSSLSNHLHRCKKYPYSNTDKKQKTLEFNS